MHVIISHVIGFRRDEYNSTWNHLSLLAKSSNLWCIRDSSLRRSIVVGGRRVEKWIDGTKWTKACR